MKSKLRPDLWGGLESTVNRVGDFFYDQTVKSGHQKRIGDLEVIAELGIKTLRYPALIWERVAPEGVEKADWRWPDERLRRLKELGIQPIVGFLHHGSGPRYTSLIDPNLPSKLESYARAVIQRYPDLELFTPVNEMMTTARFSALYGHWYPHQQNGLDFMRALFNQCHATVLAMDAVRRVNPAAKYISTEDVGKTYATPKLQYQADFDNDRRWWGYDILCGRFNDHHPAWHYAKFVGMRAAELKKYLAAFDREDMAPDIMGVNYYVTGERWLDHRVELFPDNLCGGNGQHAYADTEAVRVKRGMSGVEQILKEMWERYNLPLAITEAHLGSTVAEQMCWFKEIWDGALDARKDGVDVQAVTVWALLGLYDWDSLVTQDRGSYEPGALDLSSGVPELTRYAHMISDLAKNKQCSEALLDSEGWWRQECRILYEV